MFRHCVNVYLRRFPFSVRPKPSRISLQLYNVSETYLSDFFPSRSVEVPDDTPAAAEGPDNLWRASNVWTVRALYFVTISTGSSSNAVVTLSGRTLSILWSS